MQIKNIKIFDSKPPENGLDRHKQPSGFLRAGSRAGRRRHPHRGVQRPQRRDRRHLRRHGRHGPGRFSRRTPPSSDSRRTAPRARAPGPTTSRQPSSPLGARRTRPRSRTSPSPPATCSWCRPRPGPRRPWWNATGWNAYVGLATGAESFQTAPQFTPAHVTDVGGYSYAYNGALPLNQNFILDSWIQTGIVPPATNMSGTAGIRHQHHREPRREPGGERRDGHLAGHGRRGHVRHGQPLVPRVEVAARREGERQLGRDHRLHHGPERVRDRPGAAGSARAPGPPGE